MLTDVTEEHADSVLRVKKMVTSGNSELGKHLSVYGCKALNWALTAFQFLDHIHSVGLLEQGISPSQGRFLHKEQHEHRISAQSHPCHKWDSNPYPIVRAGEDSSCLKARPRYSCWCSCDSLCSRVMWTI
jgi:hypothetical protein